MALAKKSLAGKARERPDLVKKVVEKVAKDGIVSTAQAVLSKLDQPIPLGYSAAGLVLDRGVGAESFDVGSRVACAGAKLANHAEFNAVPVNLCVSVPESVSDEEASFVTVGAIALQGVRTAQLTLGERIAVIGLGLIGQIAVQLCKANGCRVVGVDLDPAKIELAVALGADLALNRKDDVVGKIDAFTEGRGVDAVIICAAADSNDPVELAGEISRDRGRVVVVGAVQMNVPRRPYYDKELQFFQSRSYGPGRYDPSYEEGGHDYPFGYVRWTEKRNMQAFLDLVSGKQIQVAPLITHRFDIGVAEKAYELISGATAEPFIGVVLTYGSNEEPARTVAVSVPKPRATSTPAISLIGSGGFATSVLMPELARRKPIRLHTVVSGRGVSARHSAEKFGFASCSTDATAALTAPDVDGVIISTRHDLHAQQAALALEAGKAVFLEKPVALDEAGLRLVVDAATKPGRSLMVDFNRRFAPLTNELSAFFAGRKQPMVINYRINSGRIPGDSWIHDPAVGGGRLIGEGCHFVDFCCAVAGAEVTSVSARSVGTASGSFRNDDQFVMTVGLSDGSVASIVYTAGGDSSLPKEYVEVHCGGATAILEDFRTLQCVRNGKVKRSRSFIKDKGHGAALDAFLGAIRGGTESPISLRSIVATTLATFGARDQLGTGVTVDVRAATDALVGAAS